MNTRSSRLLAIALTIAIANLMFGNMMSAANASARKPEPKIARTEPGEPDPFTPFPSGQGTPTGKQYPAEELEDLRAKLIELVNTVKEFSDLILPDNIEMARNLNAARKQFEQHSPQQLNIFRATLNPASMDTHLAKARAVLNEFRPELERIRQAKLQRWEQLQSGAIMQMESATLPGREGPDPVCNALIGGSRATFAINTAADAVLLVAAGVQAVTSRGCEQVAVAVVLGEGGGGNTSLACVAVDAVFFVAQAVRDKLQACDDDYTGRTVDASFSRLETIHTDLEGSVINDNANKAAIISNISSSQTAIVGNNNSNKTAIVNNDNANTTTILGNDNTNKTAIISNDDANKTTILAAISASQAAVNANTNAGKDELRDLIRRTQIEANLAEEGGKGFVGLYVMPNAYGGFLELVRAIVVDTITKLGGKHMDAANKDVAKGDAEKAQGHFNKAYSYYRKAYRTAVKED